MAEGRPRVSWTPLMRSEHQNEPAAISVVRPSGELVAELLVSPHKTIAHLKTQLAGLEGTAAGNQSLLLDGQPLDDYDCLASLGVYGSATMILMRCAPLLSGRLRSADLAKLISDASALEQAIEGYNDDPQYSVKEAESILMAVAEQLSLPPEHRPQMNFKEAVPTTLAEKLSLSPEHRPEKWPEMKFEEASSEKHAVGREARRDHFMRMVLAALHAVQAALEDWQTSGTGTASGGVMRDNSGSDLSPQFQSCKEI